MSHQRSREFKALKRALAENEDGHNILRCFKNVVKREQPEMTRDSLSLILQRIHTYHNQFEIRKFIFDILPRKWKDDRLLLLCNVPLVLREMPKLSKIVMTHVANTILTSNQKKYYAARNKFGNFLVQIPASIMFENEDDVEFPMSDAVRIEFLEYLEFTVEPTLSRKNMLLSNEMYLTMLSTMEGENYKKVFRCLMETESFSYFDVLTYMTKKLADRTLPFDDALMFAEKKFNVTTRSPFFGYTDSDEMDHIEYTFLNELLEPCNIIQLDKIVQKLNRKVLTSDKNADLIVKQQLEKINSGNPDELSLSFKVKHLAIRSVMSQYDINLRHDILKDALKLQSQIDELDQQDRNIYLAVLASNSFPKKSCKEFGSRELFEKLIRRLFEIVPPIESRACLIEFNEYQSILYSLYHLFRMNMSLRHSLYQIEENWRPKLINMIDLHVITSDNLNHLSTRQSDLAIKMKIRKTFEMVTYTGQLLVFLFSVLNDRKILAFPPYKNLSMASMDVRFTDTFTWYEFVKLTKTQTRRDEIVSLPHRAYLHEYDENYRQERFDVESDEGDSDWDNEGDNSSSEIDYNYDDWAFSTDGEDDNDADDDIEDDTEDDSENDNDDENENDDENDNENEVDNEEDNQEDGHSDWSDEDAPSSDSDDSHGDWAFSTDGEGVNDTTDDIEAPHPNHDSEDDNENSNENDDENNNDNEDDEESILSETDNSDDLTLPSNDGYVSYGELEPMEENPIEVIPHREPDDIEEVNDRFGRYLYDRGISLFRYPIPEYMRSPVNFDSTEEEEEDTEDVS